MAFTPKAWEDTPSTATPITAAALADLETRVTGYALQVVPFLNAAEYGSLQAAVDAAEAEGGYLVLEAGATYTVSATVTVTDPCRIIGNGATIDGAAMASGPVVAVTGDDVTLDGIRIAAPDDDQAVTFTGCDRPTAVDLVIPSCWKGITFTNCADAVAAGNDITITGTAGTAGHGILFAKSGATTASGFIFTRNAVHIGDSDWGHGIWWYGGDAATETTASVFNGVVAQNVVEGGFGGIWGSCGQFITVGNNVIRDFYDVGIDFETCLDCNASGNVITRVRGGALASLYASRRLTFTGNTVWTDRTTKDLGGGALPPSSSFFVLLKHDGADITITGNTFASVGASVTGEINLFKSGASVGVSRVTISGNHFHNGVLYALGGQSELTIEGNKWFHDFDVAEICNYVKQTSGVLVRDNDYWQAVDMAGSGEGYAAISIDQGNAASTPRCENVLIENNRVRNRPNTGIAVNTYNGTNATTYVVRNNLCANVYYESTGDPASAIRTGNIKPTDNSAATVTGF